MKKNLMPKCLKKMVNLSEKCQLYLSVKTHLHLIPRDLCLWTWRTWLKGPMNKIWRARTRSLKPKKKMCLVMETCLKMKAWSHWLIKWNFRDKKHLTCNQTFIKYKENTKLMTNWRNSTNHLLNHLKTNWWTIMHQMTKLNQVTGRAKQFTLNLVRIKKWTRRNLWKMKRMYTWKKIRKFKTKSLV